MSIAFKWGWVVIWYVFIINLTVLDSELFIVANFLIALGAVYPTLYSWMSFNYTLSYVRRVLVVFKRINVLLLAYFSFFFSNLGTIAQDLCLSGLGTFLDFKGMFTQIYDFLLLQKLHSYLLMKRYRGRLLRMFNKYALLKEAGIINNVCYLSSLPQYNEEKLKINA